MREPILPPAAYYEKHLTVVRERDERRRARFEQ